MQVLRVVVMALVGVVLCQAAAVMDAEEDVDVVEVLADEEQPVAVPAAKSLTSVATGRTFSEWGKSLMEWMGYDYDDYEEYDYEYTYYYPPSASAAQAGYGLPSVGYVSPSAGGQHSSYSSYAPVQVAYHPQRFAHPARDDNYDDDEWSIMDVMYDVAVTVIPVGLLLSALPTGLFTVVRRRSLEDINVLEKQFDPSELPLLHALVESDFLTLTSRQCQEKLFCELALLGEHEEASFLQKTFYYLAALTPDFMARKVGLARLFRTSRAGHCEMLHCSATPVERPPPRVSHLPAETNHISEVVTDPEKDAVEAAKE